MKKTKRLIFHIYTSSTFDNYVTFTFVDIRLPSYIWQVILLQYGSNVGIVEEMFRTKCLTTTKQLLSVFQVSTNGSFAKVYWNARNLNTYRVG